MKDIIEIRNDIDRLMPFAEFTKEQESMIDSMVFTLEFIRSKMDGVRPGFADEKESKEYHRLLSDYESIERSIRRLLSDAEKEYGKAYQDQLKDQHPKKIQRRKSGL